MKHNDTDERTLHLLQSAYRIGWNNCAGWADRPDFISDGSSLAFRRERDSSLDELIDTVTENESSK